VEEKSGAAFAIIDKVEREDQARSLQRLQEECGLTEGQANALLVLVQKGDLEEAQKRYGTDPFVADAISDLKEYSRILEGLGLGDFLEIDFRIVRGLAYYTGIVFELFDRQAELRAICGGGRYDRLLELVGGEPLPAVGFGMGDVVLTELLRDRGLLPSSDRAVDLFVVVIDPDLRGLALEIAAAQRSRGLSVVYPLRPVAVRKQFAMAASEGARRVVVLGPDEVAKGLAVLRDMKTGEETQVALGLLSHGEGIHLDGA
jgi:histidyl-tRNA synthetase